MDDPFLDFWFPASFPGWDGRRIDLFYRAISFPICIVEMIKQEARKWREIFLIFGFLLQF